MANTHSTDLERSSSQYWSITDASQTGLDISGDFTFEAWIKLESAPASGQYYSILGKWASSDGAYLFAYQNDAGTPYLRLDLYDDGTPASNVRFWVAQTLTTGVWYQVAATYDASANTAEFFLDGASIGTDTGTGTVDVINNSAGVFRIGSSVTDRYFDGLIDDVRVWDDIRTDAEIKTNFDKELVGTETNLQGYWKFNNDGTDATSNGNDLTNNNTATFTTTVAFDAGSTDLERGSSQYWSITDGSQTGLDLTTDFTIEAWVKVEDAPTTGQLFPFVSKYSRVSPANQRSYQWGYINNSGTLQLRLIVSSDGSTTSNHEFTQTLTAGTWYHTAVTYDLSAGTAEAFVNGTSLGTVGSGVTTLHSGSANFGIGSDIYDGHNHDGLIDEVRIWNDIRTSTEIDDNKCAELVGNEANLQAYWRFNGHEIDITDNGNRLTNNASATFSTAGFSDAATCTVTSTFTPRAIFF